MKTSQENCQTKYLYELLKQYTKEVTYFSLGGYVYPVYR